MGTTGGRERVCPAVCKGWLSLPLLSCTEMSFSLDNALLVVVKL